MSRGPCPVSIIAAMLDPELATRLEALRHRDPEGLVRGAAAQALRQIQERDKKDRKPHE